MVQFQGPDMSKRNAVGVVTTEAWWSVLASKGLTYRGTCKNSACISNTDWKKHPELGYCGRTSCKMGLGTFRANEDVDYGVVMCPGCNEVFIPQALIFQDCKAEVMYCRVGEKPVKVDFNTIGDEVETFGTHVFVLS